MVGGDRINFQNMTKASIGDIIHLDLMGQHLIVANSLKVAVDLLEKRSSVTSGRPVAEIHRL